MKLVRCTEWLLVCFYMVAMCSEWLLWHVGGCKDVKMQLLRCSEWLLPSQVAKVLHNGC